MNDLEPDLEQSLLLAAEDCPVDRFERYHYFSQHEDRIIQTLCAHGPVLLKGGRGSGKSALMIEAHRRLTRADSSAFGIYVSLRHLPLLRSTGLEYEKLLCERLSRSIGDQLSSGQEAQKAFKVSTDFAEVQDSLKDLAATLDKRIVLMFDDVAHIGREASLEEFFPLSLVGTPAELSNSDDPYVGELLRTPRRQAERLNVLLPRDGAA